MQKGPGGLGQLRRGQKLLRGSRLEEAGWNNTAAAGHGSLDVEGSGTGRVSPAGRFVPAKRWKSVAGGRGRLPRQLPSPPASCQGDAGLTGLSGSLPAGEPDLRDTQSSELWLFTVCTLPADPCRAAPAVPPPLRQDPT